MKLEEKQTSQDVEMTFLRRKLEVMQIQPTETPSTPFRKKKAETSSDVLQQLRREAKIPQPRATYPNPEDREPVKEIPPQEEGPKEPPLTPESFSETSSTIPNPPPPISEKTISAVNVESSSSATPKAPPAKPTFVKVPPQQSNMTSHGNPPRNNPPKRMSHGSNPPLRDPAPESVPHGDPESENSGSTMRTGGAAGPSQNPGKKKGPTLHARLTQQELEGLDRRLDGNLQQPEIEIAMQGQPTLGTQEGERVAGDGHMVGRRGQASDEGQDHISGSRHRAGHTEESRSTTVQFEGYHAERLSRKERDRKDANAFHQQHPPSFFGGDSTEAENWLLVINKIMEFLDCLNRQKVLFAAFKLEDDAFQNGLDESIRDMVIVEPCETHLDQRQDRDQRVKGLRTKSNDATKRNVADVISVILDAVIFNQGRTISVEKLVIGQTTVLMEWCVTGVVCRDIPLSFILQQVHLVYNSRKTRIDQREGWQHNNRMCRTQEGGSRPMYAHLTRSKHKSQQVE
ncbi:hypothetical protein ACLOJK_026563 [Asimina triloba]